MDNDSYVRVPLKCKSLTISEIEPLLKKNYAENFQDGVMIDRFKYFYEIDDSFLYVTNVSTLKPGVESLEKYKKGLDLMINQGISGRHSTSKIAIARDRKFFII